MEMNTIFHSYQFNVNNAEDARAYDALCERLRGQGMRVFKVWPDKGKSFCKPELDGKSIELETTHLFANQWNTPPIEGYSEQGLRIFDWAEDATHNTFTRQGHYLDQTEEMREIRRNTDGCGYCGKQEPAAKGNVFCPHCLDSEYLKESELHLTRMVAIQDSDRPRAPLTDAERAHLSPLYAAAQTQGSTERGRKRMAKLREEIRAKRQAAIRNAEWEFTGMQWLMDHGLGQLAANNAIFYSHTGRFGFGWRTPLDGAQLSALLDVISEFPAPYDIKTADGRTLSGD